MTRKDFFANGAVNCRVIFIAEEATPRYEVKIGGFGRAVQMKRDDWERLLSRSGQNIDHRFPVAVKVGKRWMLDYGYSGGQLFVRCNHKDGTLRAGERRISKADWVVGHFARHWMEIYLDHLNISIYYSGDFREWQSEKMEKLLPILFARASPILDGLDVEK